MKSSYPYSCKLSIIYLTPYLHTQRETCPQSICNLYELTIEEYKKNLIGINDITYYNDSDFTGDCDYSTGWSALIVACFNSKGWNLLEHAKLLIELGADVNLKTSDDIDALLCAIDNDSTELIKLLIGAGANVEKKHINRCINATNYGRVCSLDNVKLIIEKGGIIPNLLYNSLYSNIEITKYLLSKNATIDSDKIRETPLQIAVRTGKVELINLILNNKTQFGVIDNNILNYAFEFQASDQIIQMLLNSDFKFDLNNDKTKIYLLTKEVEKLKVQIEQILHQ